MRNDRRVLDACVRVNGLNRDYGTTALEIKLWVAQFRSWAPDTRAVADALRALEERGLVTSIEAERGTVYLPTDAGREMFRAAA